MRVTPPEKRSTVRRTVDALEIIIPARRNIFLFLFLTAWLVGWSVGEVLVARDIWVRQDAFVAAWLVLWTLGGAFAIYVWLWTLGGREVIRLGSTVLAIRRAVLGLGMFREYDLNYVRNLRVAPEASYPWDWSGAMRFWGVGGGQIAFDYGAATVRFGRSIDEAEAGQIVAELRSAHGFLE